MNFMFAFFAIAAGLILVYVFRSRTKREANLLKRTSQRSSTKIVRVRALTAKEPQRAKIKRTGFGRR